MEEIKKITPTRRAVDYLIKSGKVLNDKDLAEKLGLNKSTVSEYLSGTPGKKFLKNIEEKFGIKLKEFEDNVNENLVTVTMTKEQLVEEFTKLRAETDILTKYVLQMRASYYSRHLKDDRDKTGVMDEYERELTLQLQKLKNSQR